LENQGLARQLLVTPTDTDTNLSSQLDDLQQGAVVYIRPHQKCGPKDLFKKITEYLKYRVTKGTVSDFRDRTIEVLKSCGVEMLIIDEADQIKPETFADVRDIAEDLGIAVVLVGTDRLDAVIKRDEQVQRTFSVCIFASGNCPEKILRRL
jgi:DNA transposition AAA+ family ATPase